MNTHRAMALAAAVLLAGATAPSLATPPSQRSSKQALNLSKTQRQTAWKDLHSTAVTAKAPAKYPDRTGATVPRTVPLMGMPSKAAQAVPELKSYDYTMAKGKLLIVHPKSRKIADVISG